MRFPLRQRVGKQGRDCVQPGKCPAFAHEQCGAGQDRLNLETAQMFRQTRTPCNLYLVARLQDRRHPTRPAAPDNSDMSTMAAREHLDDQGIFPVTAT